MAHRRSLTHGDNSRQAKNQAERERGRKRGEDYEDTRPETTELWDSSEEAKRLERRLFNRGKTRIRICRTKAEEAGTHRMARLNTGREAGTQRAAIG